MKIWSHFPLIPWLKQMYWSCTMSQLLQWHVKNKSTNGLVRYVADSKTWAHIWNMAIFCKWTPKFEVGHFHKWFQSISWKVMPMVHLAHVHFVL
jgi:hypothetical protein